MKALIVCVSQYYGNTKKVAEAIASVLDARVIEPGQVNVASFSGFDLVGFGSGIYFAKHDPSLVELVTKLPNSGGKAFVFSTRGRNSFFEKPTISSLKKSLLKKALRLLVIFPAEGSLIITGFSSFSVE